MLRTHTCGELSLRETGKEVLLTGWVNTVRNLGSLCFVDLRDKYGITQLNIAPELYHQNPLKSEYCIQVKGIVQKREVANKELPTGEIEVKVSEITIYSKSELTPFEIKDDTTASEDLRLEYRYLDLRRPKMQRYLEVRNLINRYTREYLYENGFTEIDTPTLIKSTPEGARDYLVPSRIYPGSFYALPQSPQLYKQLLMIAGADRYFQLAHCYRDEDQRADRQPEFMQIDCEMSFVEREDVLTIIEGLVKYLFKKIRNVELPDFLRMDYFDAIYHYGSDKPDLRYDMKIQEVTDCLKDCGFAAYEGKSINCFVVPAVAKDTTRKIIDNDNLLAKKYKVFGVSHLKFFNGKFEGNIVKNNIIRTDLTGLDNEQILKLNLLLNTSLNGLALNQINLATIAKLKEQAGIHSEIVSKVLDAIAESVSEDEDLEIYTSGATNIFKYPELADSSRAQELISAFEEKQQLVSLVNDTLSDEENTGIQVYIGSESPVQTMKDCSVVTATYELGEGMKGTIGIIGPKRMDYENVVDNLKTLKNQLDGIFKKPPEQK